MDIDHRVPSVADDGLQSVKPTKAQEVDLERERIQAMDFANREGSLLKRTPTTKRKSVRFSAKRGQYYPCSDPPVAINTNAGQGQHYSARDEFTREKPAEPLQQQEELLMPVRYSPPSDVESSSGNSTLSDDSWDSIKHDVEQPRAQYTLPGTEFDKPAELIIDTATSNRGHTRNTSSFSRRGARRDSHQFDIYFTPTDYTRSQIFLSSPVPSPGLPPEVGGKEEDVDDGECATPKASMSRPPSAIFVGSEFPSASSPNEKKGREREKVKITAEQLDQLIKGLAKSQLIQRSVRKQYWDSTDLLEDEPTASVNSTSFAALHATAATPFSQSNKSLLQADSHPYANRPLSATPPPILSSGGISLLDPSITGCPVSYISHDTLQEPAPLATGSNTFLPKLPYGTDVQCSLHILPPAPEDLPPCKVLLRAINQVIDRKSGKRGDLLLADVEVTDLFAKAALTEFAEATGTNLDDIILQPPTASSSPEDAVSIVDWCALADEMQSTSDVVHLIDLAVQNFSKLKSETCAMRTLALMSELERIKDQHMDFLILLPTRFHGNGMPANMRMPWVSQRLWNDWYGGTGREGVGYGKAAREFQQGIVEEVARRATGREKFTVGVEWRGREGEQVVHCVPLKGREEQGDAWACFIRGEFDLQG